MTQTRETVELLETGLAMVFGREWLRLSHADQRLIIRDCTEDGGVSDLAQYRSNIGTGNLQRYADTMRARFNPRKRCMRPAFHTGACGPMKDTGHVVGSCPKFL